MGQLVNKFKQATLDLRDTNEIVIVQQEDNNKGKEVEEANWEASAIGKAIIEGRMSHDMVQKFIHFTCPFITAENLKIVEIDPNIFIFKFSNWDLLNKVINERPWNINKKLLVIHDYIPEMIYTEKQWGFQLFWIQLKFLLQEHMNVSDVTKIGEIMGEVVKIELENVVPVDGVPVKVCVYVDICNPLRRGVKVISSAGLTRWIKFYYERQPPGICNEGYIIKYCNVVCKDASEFLAKSHEKPHFFGKVCNLRKSISSSKSVEAPTSRKNQKNFVKNTVSVPPKDGITVNMDFLLKQSSDDGEEDTRLGKRHRASSSTTLCMTNHETSSYNADNDKNMGEQAAHMGTTIKAKTVNASEESQGLKTSTTRDHLNDLVRMHNPDMIFLCETKSFQNKSKPLLRNLHYPNQAYIEPVGLSFPSLERWLHFCMYGYHDYNRKKEQWEYLLDISNSHSSPWILIGDLNFHLIGDNQNASSSLDGNNIINSCGLEDLGYVGKDYTWTRNNISTSSRRSRIDMALENNDCSVIENAWKIEVVGSPGFQLMKKFQSTRKELSLWNRTHFGDVNTKVDNLQKELDSLLQMNLTTKINGDLSMWHKRKAELYQQKSRDHFISEMDNNSKEEISQHLTSHFKDISTSAGVQLDDNSFMLLPSIISESDNELLSKVPSHQEIFDTLKSMENWSAPGPEGFQAGFYKSHWSIISEDVYQMVTRFFETKHILKQINKSYISLIPKKRKFVCAADYSPIDLCNTYYKIISKIIVNGLKPLMEKIIFPYQAAYVSERLISDNTVIAQEIIHSMKRKRGQIGWMSLKIDMSKAFDRLE
ncbi:uncharacterized protein LOC113351753 [Papaver somniferum]|uniref:uncharacterized protein LOC113351753 n=1 Tax=Papaver somniferum TaxID=3469 RepID=UPI000E6FE82A|nr:uncharacterized protein LOC113351753 [Papaver somniferum]